MNQYPEDPYHLERFVEAQNPVYDQVCWELQQGLKMTHWIWFIFPQLQGLSSSDMSRKFAISSLEEAIAYMDYPVLRARLFQCTELINNTPGRTIKRIIGATDSTKFQSCMTLFTYATIKNQVFEFALEKYFSGKKDQRTLDRL
ncbi:DUF1810 domain-containing protein [SAR202 cluster bacterium AD-802-F09_MRT_200m]|nr:DUF1810 domain-containing protein [SAR202 cluster bacterium AD-802-F09_MRT_200m]